MLPCTITPKKQILRCHRRGLAALAISGHFNAVLSVCKLQHPLLI